MSGARELAGRPDTGEPKRPVADYLSLGASLHIEWIARPVFGVLLATAAIGATLLGGIAFIAFLAIGTAAAIREWHRMFAKRDFLLPASVTVIATVVALLWQLYAAPGSSGVGRFAPFVILAFGCLTDLQLGILRHEAPIAHAFGPLYLGIPPLALLLLRQSAADPILVVLLVLLTVWATDTGALLSGRVMGGPKLVPSVSPNKTWAGLLGGTLCAAAMGAAFAAVLGTPMAPAVIFGAAMAVAGHAGDLVESTIKRRMGRKDSGGLIPGHGGVLDRIDSILFAAPVAAVAVLVFNLNPLAGAHP